MILKEKLKIIFSILIIVLIIGYFQRESLKLDIFWDDYNAFRAYSFEDLIKGFYKSTAALMESSVHAYRPMFQVMFHAAYSICGFNSFKLHAMMIALQVLQTVTAFLFFRLLTQRDSVALASSLLFSLNPNLWMHFTWASELSAASGMIPFLLSLMSLIYYIRNPKSLMLFSHCFFAAWAYLTKETYAPIFFISILTIIFYGKHNYRKYLSLAGWHMVIFIIYLAIRFIILRKWGAQGITPDNYSGIEEYLWNYITFIGKISLFTHYISLGPWHILLYIGMACLFFIALKNVLISFKTINRKLLFIVFSVFLLPTYWLVTHINDIPGLFQLRPIGFEGFLISYSTGLYILIAIIWNNRKTASNKNEQFTGLPAFIEEKSKTRFNVSPGLDQKESLVKFFSYSFLFLLISGLPMLFFPDGRIMNVTALGMGGVFASSFFIVLSMIGEVSCKFPLMKPLRYSLYFIFILFILNNGLIFKDQYTSSDSVYGKYISLRRSIGIYVAFYPYFIKYNLKEQGTHLFNTLVSNGLVDAASGKLIMERIKYLYPEIVRNTCKTESELQDFQPFDNKIYPITN